MLKSKPIKRVKKKIKKINKTYDQKQLLPVSFEHLPLNHQIQVYWEHNKFYSQFQLENLH